MFSYFKGHVGNIAFEIELAGNVVCPNVAAEKAKDDALEGYLDVTSIWDANSGRKINRVGRTWVRCEGRVRAAIYAGEVSFAYAGQENDLSRWRRQATNRCGW